jgi:arabinofuranan 3-O-arabinosyltransferase
VAAVHEVLPTRGSLSRPTPAADTRGPSARTRALVGYVLLAALAYVPVLLTAPGKVAADTKQYFYLDPARLLSRAVSMWDPHTALGTVTHQNIGYLFPAGPYFWLTNELGIPAWIAQRLWLGSILFGAATGLLYLARTLSLRGPGIVIAALAYMLSPYSLQYASRLSTLLIAWAALPWMVALVARALRDGGWRYPAVFAIVVQLAGSVNATALIFAGIGPLLWIVYEVWIAREVKPREALATVARVGVLCIAASLWWISGLSVQAAYGLDELKYSETVRAVSTAGLAPEILRGLGYWFFYGGDKLAPWTDNVVDYTQRRWLLATSYAIPIGALLFAAFIRWKHRVYFALLILVGLTIAVGTHPYSSPSPFGAIVKAFSEGSTVGLALRSVGRAYPLIGLALALLLGWRWAWPRPSARSSSSTCRRSGTGRSTARTSLAPRRSPRTGPRRSARSTPAATTRGSSSSRDRTSPPTGGGTPSSPSRRGSLIGRTSPASSSRTGPTSRPTSSPPSTDGSKTASSTRPRSHRSRAL